MVAYLHNKMLLVEIKTEQNLLSKLIYTFCSPGGNFLQVFFLLVITDSSDMKKEITMEFFMEGSTLKTFTYSKSFFTIYFVLFHGFVIFNQSPLIKSLCFS